MADYRPGDGFRLYLDTANNWSTPTWVEIVGYSDLAIDPAKGDVEVSPQTKDTGHLHGSGNPAITFTLLDNAGDNNIETLVLSSLNGDQVHLAIADGDITANNTRYWHMESVLFSPQTASRGSVSSYDVTANKHANSDNELTRTTTP